jgi:4-amino-4-deoxychorismate lyase
MSLLVESIWVKNKIVMNIACHQQRYASTLHDLYPQTKPMDLNHAIDIDLCPNNDVKCRIIYSDTLHSVEYHTYIRKPICSLKCIETNDLNYTHKYLNRDALTELYAKREGCDEIIIINNGYITDAYYYNLVFENDYGLFTPKIPLLAGTMRQHLLFNRVVSPASITFKDLNAFKNIHLINALNPLGYQQVNKASVL